MMPIDGAAILTAAEMRAAEDAAIAAGSSVSGLMERAGAGVAEAARRLASGAPILILCGPGNNGGDGYVAARLLKAGGVEVSVAASGPARGEAAMAARQAWDGPVGSPAEVTPAPILVDALFGTGLSRPLDADLVTRLHILADAARLRIAVDVPSGVATDDAAVLSLPPACDLTLALGAVKRAHVLQPAARYCGEVRLLDLGLDVSSACHIIEPYVLREPGPESHKYSRGMVAIVAGAMPGAAALAAEAALRAGAGYVLLLADERPADLPHAVVSRPWSADALDDARIGTVLIGPGLGRDAAAARRLDAAMASRHRLVIDGDALHLLADRHQALARRGDTILTPHAGEFAALFGKPAGSKIDAARAAAAQARAVVVFKGADTVIAAPDGAARVAPNASVWLSTAGTGDVLAGVIAGLAATMPAADAAAAGVWLHGQAARRLGAAFVADDLARAVSTTRAA